jgi:Complex I intermediate-associated protein 30 (CIA30)
MISKLLFLSFSATRFCSGVNMSLKAGSDIVGVGSIVWSSSPDSTDLGWYALDDVIMGGQSKSNLPPGSKFDGIWTGMVTTDGGGGFAGIRTKPFPSPIDASAASGFLLDLTGDGQRYKFIARDTADYSGVAWATSFDTVPNQRMQIEIPWDMLIPTMRARKVVSSPFNKSRISAVQMTLSKFEYDGATSPSFKNGPFRLELHKISIL